MFVNSTKGSLDLEKNKKWRTLWISIGGGYVPLHRPSVANTLVLGGKEESIDIVCWVAPFRISTQIRNQGESPCQYSRVNGQPLSCCDCSVVQSH